LSSSIKSRSLNVWVPSDDFSVVGSDSIPELRRACFCFNIARRSSFEVFGIGENKFELSIISVFNSNSGGLLFILGCELQVLDFLHRMVMALSICLLNFNSKSHMITASTFLHITLNEIWFILLKRYPLTNPLLTIFFKVVSVASPAI
jgi:hypothetical protein